MIRDICKDQAFLAQKAEPASPEDLPVAADLLETLEVHRDGCVGMAANMIGVNKRIIAFDNQGGYMVMFNPEIVKRAGPYEAEEGCLSLSGTRRARRWSPSRSAGRTKNSRSGSRPSPAGRPRLSSTRSTTARASSSEGEGKPMKLAILSDTHGLLRPEVTEHLKTADAILHGGDINRQSIVDELRQYAPLYIVRGNNDKDWAEAIPHDLTVTLGGVTFFMVHNRKEVPADLAGVDAVVFGHSHKYVQEEKGGVLWLNPGSCGPRRFHQEITMMTAEAEDGKIRVEKVIIPHGTA